MSTTTQLDLAIKAFSLINDRYRSRQYSELTRVNGSTIPISECVVNLIKIDKKSKRNQKLSETFDTQPIHSEDDEKELEPQPLESIGNIMNFSSDKRVLVLGKAGIGKTAFCKKLLHIYAANILTEARQIIHITLRNLKLKRYTDLGRVGNLLDLFYNEYFTQADSHDLNGTELAKAVFSVYNSNPERLIFLLDGLDEVQEILGDKNHPMNECLLNLLENSNSYVIMTSRPYGNFNNFSIQVIYELSGFNKTDVKKYLALINPTPSVKTSPINGILKFIDGISIISTLVHIPIQLDILCCFFQSYHSHFARENGIDTNFTMTDLYSNIVIWLWRQYLEKEQSFTTVNMNNKIISKLFESETKFLGNLAFDMLKKNSIQFTKDELPENASITLINKIVQSFVLQSESLVTGINERVYNFVHLTFQEFFAATYIVANLNEEFCRRFICLNKYNQRYQNVWQFSCGLCISSDEGSNYNLLKTFWSLIERHPRDLLRGPAHNDLILNCLRESENFLATYEVKRLSIQISDYFKYSHNCYSSTLALPESVIDQLIKYVLNEHLENFISKKIQDLLLYQFWFSQTHISSLMTTFTQSVNGGDRKLGYMCESMLLRQELLTAEQLKIVFEKGNSSIESWKWRKSQSAVEITMNYFLQQIDYYLSTKEYNLVIENKSFLKIIKIMSRFPEIPLWVVEKIGGYIMNKIYPFEIRVLLLKSLDGGLPMSDVGMNLFLFLLNEYNIILNENPSLNNFNEGMLPILFKILKNGCPKFPSEACSKMDFNPLRAIEIISHCKTLSSENVDILLKIIMATRMPSIPNKNYYSFEVLRYHIMSNPLSKKIVQIIIQQENLTSLEKLKKLEVFSEFISFSFDLGDIQISDEPCMNMISSWLDRDDKYLRQIASLFLTKQFHTLSNNQKESTICQVVNLIYSEKQISLLSLNKHLNHNGLELFYYKIAEPSIFNQNFEINPEMASYLKRESQIDKVKENDQINLQELSEKLNNFNKLPISLQNETIEELTILEKISDQLENDIIKNLSIDHMLEIYNYKSSCHFSNKFYGKGLSVSQFLRTIFRSFLINGKNMTPEWQKSFIDEILIKNAFNTNSLFKMPLELCKENQKTGCCIFAYQSVNLETFECSPDLLKIIKKVPMSIYNPNSFNDLSIYFKFYPPNERISYLKNAIESCTLSTFTNLTSCTCQVYKDEILGFLKIELNGHKNKSSCPNCLVALKDAISKNLQDFELIHFDLSNNGLTDENACEFTSILAKYSKLESLILSLNKISSTGFIQLLSDIVKADSSLSHLFLDHNAIQLRENIEWDLVQKLVKQSKNLGNIDLTINYIPEEIFLHTKNNFLHSYNPKENKLGSIYLCSKLSYLPPFTSHAFLVMIEILEKIGQKKVSTAELFVNRVGNVKITLRCMDCPVKLNELLSSIESKTLTSRTAQVTEEQFNRLHEEIERYKRTQGFMDYAVVPLGMGLGFYNCVSWQSELLKKAGIVDTSYVVSTDPKFFRLILKTLKWGILLAILLCIAFLLYWLL